MSDEQHVSPFEQIRHETDNGGEYWSARELSKVLGYTEYSKFKNSVQKAIEACENSSHAVDDHFAHVSDMVTIGSGAQRKIEDVHLSRYACYLVVQNADPSKEIVALGQTYFAVQTQLATLSCRKPSLIRMSRSDLKTATYSTCTGDALASLTAATDCPISYVPLPFLTAGNRQLWVRRRNGRLHRLMARPHPPIMIVSVHKGLFAGVRAPSRLLINLSGEFTSLCLSHRRCLSRSGVLDPTKIILRQPQLRISNRRCGERWPSSVGSGVCCDR